LSVTFDATAASSLGTKLATGVGGLVLAVALLAGAAGAGVASIFGGGDVGPSATATAQIPSAMLVLYQEAAATCDGLPWTVLAAIGTVESDNGASNLPGVHSGANSAGAEGPMQFEPATFAEYDMPLPPGGENPPSPYDATDAVYAAARLLCANGAANGANLSGAVYAYNHSASYVSQVLALAQSYGQSQAATVAAGTAGGVAVDWALAQVGTPYVWGGETPGVGFDCSGLVQAAYKVAGITLPRVAQDQYDATAKLGPGDPVDPGDLLFYGGGADDVTHVGIYVGNGTMVDAPHSGADVRVEATPTTPGSRWGSDVLVGITDPSLGQEPVS
jgi:cell wall-associated NlpC family hydrolase